MTKRNACFVARASGCGFLMPRLRGVLDCLKVKAQVGGPDAIGIWSFPKDWLKIKGFWNFAGRPTALDREAAILKPVVEIPAVESDPVWCEAKKVLRAQAVLTALTSLIVALVWGAQAGAWCLAGGAVCIAPSAWFASRLSRAAVRSPGHFAIWFFAGEVVKVLAMVLLLAAAFRASGTWGGLALIAGFVAAMQGYFLALRRSEPARGGTNETTVKPKNTV